MLPAFSGRPGSGKTCTSDKGALPALGEQTDGRARTRPRWRAQAADREETEPNSASSSARKRARERVSRASRAAAAIAEHAQDRRHVRPAAGPPRNRSHGPRALRAEARAVTRSHRVARFHRRTFAPTALELAKILSMLLRARAPGAACAAWLRAGDGHDAARRCLRRRTRCSPSAGSAAPAPSCPQASAGAVRRSQGRFVWSKGAATCPFGRPCTRSRGRAVSCLRRDLVRAASRAPPAWELARATVLAGFEDADFALARHAASVHLSDAPRSASHGARRLEPVRARSPFARRVRLVRGACRSFRLASSSRSSPARLEGAPAAVEARASRRRAIRHVVLAAVLATRSPTAAREGDQGRLPPTRPRPARARRAPPRRARRGLAGWACSSEILRDRR